MVVARPRGFRLAGSAGEPSYIYPAAPFSTLLPERADEHLKGALRATQRHPPQTSSRDRHFVLPAIDLSGRSAANGGGEMVFKIAIVLLAAWLLGVLGLYNIGDTV